MSAGIENLYTRLTIEEEEGEALELNAPSETAPNSRNSFTEGERWLRDSPTMNCSGTGETEQMVVDKTGPSNSVVGVTRNPVNVDDQRIFGEKIGDRLETATVDLLWISNSNKWDVDVLMKLFNERDRAQIMYIPLSLHQTEDIFSWAWDHRGEYTVKSGYNHLLFSQFADFNPPTMRWNLLWRLHVAPKIRNFLWRAFNRYLPTITALRSHKIDIVNSCTLCQFSEEDDYFSSHENWKSASSLPISSFTCSSTVSKWSKSQLGWLKCNVDASTRCSFASFGGVLCNDKGEFIAGIQGAIREDHSAQMAEAFGIQKMLKLIQLNGYIEIYVEHAVDEGRGVGVDEVNANNLGEANEYISEDESDSSDGLAECDLEEESED
ncbi:hypothetical protein LguiA_016339 [Lonicera macranthoides]